MAGQPSNTAVHVTRPITNMVLAYMQSDANFVAGRVFPRLPVAKRSDKYFTFPRETFLTSRANLRAEGAAVERRGYEPSTDSYDCTRYAIGTGTPDPIKWNADAPLNLDQAEARLLATDMMIRIEVDWASKFFANGLWNASTSPSPTWDDVSSDPIKDVKDRNRTMQQNTGLSGNTMVFGAKAFDDLSRHPDILDRLKYTGTAQNPADVTAQGLAALFGVERVFVLRATRNTSAEGASASYSFVGGARHALLLHVPANPGIMVASPGYQFVWTGAPGNAAGVTVKTWRDEAHETDVREAEMWWEHKLTASVLGEFWNNAVAA